MPVVDILKLTQILQNIIKAKSLMRVQILDPAFIILQHFMTPKLNKLLPLGLAQHGLAQH